MNKIKRFKVIRQAMENRVIDRHKWLVSDCVDRIGKDYIEEFLELLNVIPFDETELEVAEKKIDEQEAANRCGKCKRTHYHCRCR